METGNGKWEMGGRSNRLSPITHYSSRITTKKGSDMKALIVFAALALAASPALGQRKSCDELKSEIEAKLKEKGVTAYTLDIVPNDKVGEAKVVGSCDGGTKKITYKRG
jgi:hypothetical protein